MAVFTSADISTLNMCMHWLNVWFSDNLLAPVKSECSYTAEEIGQIIGQIKAASDHLASFPGGHDRGYLEDVHLPALKRAVVVGRLRVAADIERRGQNVQALIGTFKIFMSGSKGDIQDIRPEQWR
jgi:hypothetical protein